MVKQKQVEPPLSDEILLLTIEELRRTLDWLSAAYDSVKAKTLTFMGAGLALLVFLYASGNIFFPHETYGRIFYIIGLGLVIAALVMLCISLLPRIWEFTVDSKELEAMNFEDYNHYLQYVKTNYVNAYHANAKTYANNHQLLNRSFFPLVIGAIILVVLKIFGA